LVSGLTGPRAAGPVTFSRSQRSLTDKPQEAAEYRLVSAGQPVHETGVTASTGLFFFLWNRKKDQGTRPRLTDEPSPKRFGSFAEIGRLLDQFPRIADGESGHIDRTGSRARLSLSLILRLHNRWHGFCMSVTSVDDLTRRFNF
jgi:hypothetical protein